MRELECCYEVNALNNNASALDVGAEMIIENNSIN